jgi:predicted Rdx family selenoprotein
MNRARIEPTTEKTIAGGNIQVESFLVSHGVELGIEQKTAISMVYPGRVTWEGVPVPVNASALELFVAEHDRVAFIPGPGAVIRVRVNGETLFETTIDSRRNESHRRWFPVHVDLAQFAGRTVAITFEAEGGPWPDKPAESQGPSPISVGFAEARIR